MKTPILRSSSPGVSQTMRLIRSLQEHCASPPSAVCVMGERDTEAGQYVFSSLDPVQDKGPELARIEDRPPFLNWALSPDGTQVAVVHNDDDSIHIVTLANGEERVLRLTEWQVFEFISWARDGTGFYISEGGKKDRYLV